MPELYQGKYPIITGSLDQGFLRNFDPDEMRLGAVERDYDEDPVEMRDSPSEMKRTPRSDWDAIYDEKESQKSSLLHRYMEGDKPAFPNLQQNGHGYCWAYSVGHCIMLDRLKRNYPPIRINPHATAAIIKKGRDEGGWCGLSMKFGREHGYAVEGDGPGQWPLHSRNLKYDTPELRANMAMHKVVEDWYDLGRREYDQTLSQEQIATCWADNNPMAWDFNRYSHSMGGLGLVRIERGSWGLPVIQSWPQWGYHSIGILREIWPNNAVALRFTAPSVG